jgi:GNAT superfamily N-acetyltransferase
MEFNIVKSRLAEIEALRDLFLRENNFQFIYNKCHSAGWADVYLFSLNGEKVGYGSVWGKDRREDRDTIFEFFMTKPCRKYADQVFTEFTKVSAAGYVECQSNDLLLTRMLFVYSENINAEAILFEDGFETTFEIPGISFTKNEVPDGGVEYRLELYGELMATGGFVWNYNLPFIDLYYEVEENHRKKGFGTLIMQELKKEAYLLGRIPAARCNVKNLASRNTLIKAGMKICGYILVGKMI